MSRAKSQPPQLGKNQDKKKSDFVYKAEDDMYLFQTRDLFMQVQFRSPIKQIQQYLQQYEKYCFHAQMTSIGIKSSQQKIYYDQLFNLIHTDFHHYLQKTMDFIQQMLMNVHFMKVERWHYFTQLIRGYKTQILHKDIDCYDFNPEQFKQSYEEVMQYLSKAKDITSMNNRKQVQEIKLKIRKNQKLIKYKLDQIYDSMFVKNPIRTQNQSKKQIDSDQLFYSYMNKVLYKTQGNQSCLPMRFHNAYDSVTKFFGVLKQLSLKSQQMAIAVAKEYNDNCSQTLNQIARNKFKFDKKFQIQLNDCKISTKRNDKLAPILRNKIQKVDISNRVICKDQQTHDSYGMLFVEDSKTLTPIKTEEDELFSNRVPANNPYFDFWAHVYDRDRLRKLQLFYQMPKKPRKYNQGALIARQYANRYGRKIGKEKIFIEQSQYYEIIKQREKQQSKIWEIKDKKENNCRNLYQYVDDTQKKKDMYYRPTPEEQSKIDKLTLKVKAYKQYHEKHEKQLKSEIQSKLARLPKSTRQKNYVQYAIKFAIKDIKQQYTATTIFRYGIQLHKGLTDNLDIPKFEEFLFNFLRQKLFRQNDKYKDKDSTPFIFNGKPASEFCNLKTIKKLGELTKDFKRYYIWASDIIKYQEFEELTGIKKQTKGRFTFYSYSNLKNSQSLLFELKRRLNIKVIGEIVDIYKQFGPCCIQTSLSKLQLVHRLLFNQHIETPTAHLSFEKGRQLYNSIVKGLSNMSTSSQDTASYKNQ